MVTQCTTLTSHVVLKAVFRLVGVLLFCCVDAINVD